MSFDTSNELFSLAVDMVNQSARNIFLTGKAGTGKTTFLRYIRENCAKQIAVVAPTGVAAINAGGVTMHSFFQLPLMPYLPEARSSLGENSPVVNRHDLLSRLRMNREKISLLQELELLVIDEISMVRCDTLDAVDAVLRHARNKPLLPFGGIQVLFIGDMFQLPPVTKEDAWRLLSPFYNSPYFFDSKVLQNAPPVCIEFNKIYRQSEERFIRLLNQVRNNQVDNEGMDLLRERFQPDFRRRPDDGYIILTTHNDKAREVNQRELRALTGIAMTFRADIENDFPENSFPVDEVLELKIGAQVMFIKNDPEKIKRFYNGKIGTIVMLDRDKIQVQCQGDEKPIEVKREKWDNIRYDLDAKTKTVEPLVLGSFSQYPLRLAWAITIHKSQGLSFEKAIIDAGRAFAPGQVYVALSRCTSFEGMILQSMVNRDSLAGDPRIIRFSQSQQSSDTLKQELAIARQDYLARLLFTAFDWSNSLAQLKELETLVEEHKTSFNTETPEWLSSVRERLDEMQQLAGRFQEWMKQQIAIPGPLEENTGLSERVGKAAAHFSGLSAELTRHLLSSPAVTDSKLHAKEYNELLKGLFGTVSQQQFLLKDIKGLPDMLDWHGRKRKFTAPAFPVNAYAGSRSGSSTDSPHPSLHFQLRKLRDAICTRKDLPVYLVAGSKSIDEMAIYLPQTAAQLEQVSGFGKAKVKLYGNEFLELIREYCMQHDIDPPVRESPGKSSRKKQKPVNENPERTDTKAISFQLFSEGMSMARVAAERKLTVNTIVGHLIPYVENGALAIDRLVDPDRLVTIMNLLKTIGKDQPRLSDIKSKLDEEISFTDIKFALALYTHQTKGSISS